MTARYNYINITFVIIIFLLLSLPIGISSKISVLILASACYDLITIGVFGTTPIMTLMAAMACSIIFIAHHVLNNHASSRLVFPAALLASYILSSYISDRFRRLFFEKRNSKNCVTDVDTDRTSS